MESGMQLLVTLITDIDPPLTYMGPRSHALIVNLINKPCA